MTRKDVAAAKAKFCERFAASHPAQAAKYRRFASAWWQVYLTA